MMLTLADREAGAEPCRLDFGAAGDQASLSDYLLAWRIWRAMRRDAQLQPAEIRAKYRALEEMVSERS